jgi:hypothetical protein
MSLFRLITITAALLSSAPAFAQQPPEATITITATQQSGRPTLMAYVAQHPMPDTADALVAQLNQPNTCGKKGWAAANPYKACAIIVYYLVGGDETARTPLLAFRAIYSVTHPANPLETSLSMLDLDGKVKIFDGKNLDEPLRRMRVPHSCRYRWDLTRDESAKFKTCKRVNALYEPLGILGYIENDEENILTGRFKDGLFNTF